MLTMAPIWLPRGRLWKYSSDSCGGTFSTGPSTRTYQGPQKFLAAVALHKPMTSSFNTKDHHSKRLRKYSWPVSYSAWFKTDPCKSSSSNSIKSSLQHNWLVLTQGHEFPPFCHPISLYMQNTVPGDADAPRRRLRMPWDWTAGQMPFHCHN